MSENESIVYDVVSIDNEESTDFQSNDKLIEHIPVELWGLNPNFFSYHKLLISDIGKINCHIQDDLRTFYLHNHPISRVEILGQVTTYSKLSKKQVLRLSDGEDSIHCFIPYFGDYDVSRMQIRLHEWVYVYGTLAFVEFDNLSAYIIVNNIKRIDRIENMDNVLLHKVLARNLMEQCYAKPINYMQNHTINQLPSWLPNPIISLLKCQCYTSNMIKSHLLYCRCIATKAKPDMNHRLRDWILQSCSSAIFSEVNAVRSEIELVDLSLHLFLHLKSLFRNDPYFKNLCMICVQNQNNLNEIYGNSVHIENFHPRNNSPSKHIDTLSNERVNMMLGQVLQLMHADGIISMSPKYIHFISTNEIWNIVKQNHGKFQLQNGPLIVLLLSLFIFRT